MEELDLLVKLQAIDSEKAVMRKREGEIPQDIRSLEAEIAKREGEIQKEEERIEEDKKRRRLLEFDLDASNETVRRYQRQLLEVKSNKEYTALLHEIEGEKEKVSKLEEEVLILMEEIDEVAKKVVVSKQDLEKERSSCGERKRLLEAELATVTEGIAVKDDERNRVVVRLRHDLAERYERVRQRWGGLAVVEISRSVCGGCYTALPPQFINEMKKRDRIMICEHCGRILVWKEV